MTDVAELGFKVDSSGVVKATENLEKLSDASGRTETATQQMARNFESVGAKMKGFGDSAVAVGGFLSTRVTAPLLAAATAAGAFAIKFANTADEVAKSAREIGISGQAFQELSFALGQVSQVSEGEARRGLQTLNTALGQAAAGSDTLIAAFARVGISVEEISSGTVGTEEAFERLVDFLGQTTTSAEAAAVASELLGSRVGRTLGPTLRESAGDVAELRDQFRQLGLGISDEALGNAEAFKDQLDVLQRQLGAAGAAIGSALLPALIELGPVLQDRILPAVIRFAESIADLISWFAALPGPVQEAAGLVALALGAGGPIIMAVGVLSKVLGGLLIAAGPIGLFIAAATLLYIAWQKWGDEFTALAIKVVGFVTDTFNAFVERVRTIFAGIGDAITSAFLGPLGRVQSATEAATTKIADTWAWLSDTLVGNSIIPDMNDAIEHEFDRHYAVLGDKNAAAVGAMRDQFEDLRRVLTESMEFGGVVSEEDRRADEYADRLEFLRAALEAEAITRDEFREIEMMASQEFDLWRQDQAALAADRQIEEAQRVADAEQQLHAQRLAGFSSFFGNLATATAAGGKKTFALFKAFAIAQAVIDAIAAAQGAYKVGASIGGPKLGAAFAAAAAAAQGARLAQIRATDYTGTASSNAGTRGGGSGGSPAPLAPPAPRSQDVTIRLDSNRTLFSRSEIEQILEGLNDALADGAQIRIAR